MNDTRYYEEVLKNIGGSLEAIITIAQRSNDSTWMSSMDAIESTAKQGLLFLRSCAGYGKAEPSSSDFHEHDFNITEEN